MNINKGLTKINGSTYFVLNLDQGHLDSQQPPSRLEA